MEKIKTPFNLRQNEKWTDAGENIEIVSNFNYLSIVLSSGGSFVKATHTLVGKALKAMHALLSITKEVQVPVKIMFNLFESFVGSILNYSCEVWGFATAENIERVHRKFCWFKQYLLISNIQSCGYNIQQTERI